MTGASSELTTAAAHDLTLGPGHPGHDGTAVARHRREELDRSCELLGISDLELLGYHDSGMMGWPQNDAPHAFWNTPIAEAAGRLGELMKQYKPQALAPAHL